YLEDNQLCEITPDTWRVLRRDMGGMGDIGRNGDTDTSSSIEPLVHYIDWETETADKGDFEHYMLKEIYEQPEALENAMRGRLLEDEGTAHFGGLNLDSRQLRQVQ